MHIQIDLDSSLVDFSDLKCFHLMVNQGDWTNVARSMVSMFIKQSHIINLESFRVFSQRFKSKPVYPACFLLVDDMDCPNVGGNGGNQDGDVDDGEGEREAVVHRGCCPCVEAEVQVPPQRHQPCFYLHVF